MSGVDGNPRWQKGVSGNPSGRPKDTPEVREAKDLARAKCPDAVRRLVELMGSKDEKVSLAACQSILDRGMGRPVQAIVGDEENPLSLLHRIERVIVKPEQAAGQNDQQPQD